MRANTPIDDVFNSFEPPKDEPVEQAITDDQKRLAAIGKSSSWKKVLKFTDKMQSDIQNELFKSELTGKDPAAVGQLFLMAQALTHEITSITEEVRVTTEGVLESLGAKEISTVAIDYSIITGFLDQKIDNYKRGLFGEDLAGKSASVLGQRFIAARVVIKKLTELKVEIEKNVPKQKQSS